MKFNVPLKREENRKRDVQKKVFFLFHEMFNFKNLHGKLIFTI